MVYIRRRVNRLVGRLLVLLVLMSFGVLTGYSVLLHNHDLNFDHAKDDCASCQWTQSHKTDKTHSPEITKTFSTHAIKYRAHQVKPQTVHSSFYSRGPPAFL